MTFGNPIRKSPMKCPRSVWNVVPNASITRNSRKEKGKPCYVEMLQPIGIAVGIFIPHLGSRKSRLFSSVLYFTFWKQVSKRFQTNEINKLSDMNHMNEIKWNEEWGNEKKDEVFFSKSWLFLAQHCLKPWTTISLSAPQADDTLKRWSGLAMSFFILKQWKKHCLIREVGCGFPEQEIVWQQRIQDTCRWPSTVKRCKSHLFSPQLRVSETIWVSPWGTVIWRSRGQSKIFLNVGSA